MMCAPPSARGPIRPSDAMNPLYAKFKGVHFYQSYLAQPECAAEIMRDLRRYVYGPSDAS
ncbi:MAG TPA: hypothetical protein VF764_04035, partial [Steroidobacteraceae bacterium]